MSYTECRAIVIGTDHNNTLGIIRSLGENKIPVDVIILGKKPAFIAKSKYLSKIDYCCADKISFINLLSNIQKTEENGTVLIPACDKAVELLDVIPEGIKESFNLPFVSGEKGSLVKLMDKSYALGVAQKTGLRVPSGFEVIIRGQESVQHVLKKFEECNGEFPVIIKPKCSFDGSKNQIVIVQNKKELRQKLKEIGIGNYLIQQYLDIQTEYGVQGLVTYDGKVIIPGIVKKIRQSTVAKGSTTYAKIEKNWAHHQLV